MIWDIIDMILRFFDLFPNGNGKKKDDKEAREHFKNLK